MVRFDGCVLNGLELGDTEFEKDRPLRGERFEGVPRPRSKPALPRPAMLEVASLAGEE